jgi:uncharacterized membrane protein YhaH (DUF805 family)
MKWDLVIYAERSRYRPISIALEFATYLALAAVLVGVPSWLCFLLAASLSVILTIMTYHRLRNGAFSGAWILLMILQFGVGPTWHLSGHLTVNLGGTLISCVPVILGWLAPTNASEYADAKSA